MDFVLFQKEIEKHFLSKGWDKNIVHNNIYYSKNYNNYVINTKNKYLFDDALLFQKLNDVFNSYEIHYRCCDSLLNNDGNTDFLIAGLQLVESYLLNKKELEKKSLWLLQPVIRLNNLSLCGSEDGYLSSFINICTIDVETDIYEYISRLEQWISILSYLSLHVSGLKLVLKDKTTAFDGVGVEFQYKGIDLGQANIYEINSDNHKKYVSDFGFGYERLLWILNGSKNFYAPIFPNYEVINNNFQYNDRLRTFTLLVLSGIIPAANGINGKVRKIINSCFEMCNNCDCNMLFAIEYYYNYYKKFIVPKYDLNTVIKIFLEEYNNYIKRFLCVSNGINNYSNKSLDEVCKKLILKNI